MLRARSAQTVRVLLLAGLALYNVATFHENLLKYASTENAPIVAALPRWLRGPWLTGVQAWPANWRMFTFKDPSQVFVDFEGWVPAPTAAGDPDEAGGYWVRLPMERWYPARWESGYRWDKGGVENPAARKGWLHGACDHANEEATRGGAAVTKTRAVVLHWAKSTGRSWQPQKQRKARVLGGLACTK